MEKNMEAILKEVESITPEELQRILDGEGDWFLLDVRNDIEYDQWKLEGKKTPPTLNIPYFDFFDNEDEQVGKIPPDRPVLVVCAKGDSSAFVADILKRKGCRAVNLQGGTAAWGDYYVVKEVPRLLSDREGGRLLQINRVGKGCLSYMLISGGEALVVDPGRHVQTYLDLAESEGVRILQIMDTHLHADHISGAPELARATGATYHIQKSDVGDSPLKYQPLADGEVFEIGGSKLKVIAHHLPGHTPGSTSFLIDDHYLLTGDTLFVEGVGRPDLGGKVEEWARMLYDSLFHRLIRFTEDLVILPAHFSKPEERNKEGVVMGSLMELREENPALQVQDEESFVRYIASRITSQPEIYQEIRRVNLQEREVDERAASEMELGKNECAAAPHEEQQGRGL